VFEYEIEFEKVNKNGFERKWMWI